MRRTDLLSSAGSQAATNEAGNKVVTVGRRTHVTWQDVTPEGYFNRVRTLDLDSGEWSETHTLGSAYDDHARAVMVADGDGFLHAILSGHKHALHLSPLAAGQRRVRLDRPGARGRRHLSLPGVRPRRRPVPGAAQRGALERRRIVYETTRRAMASCRQGDRAAGRLPGIRGVPLRVLLRRGRRAAPGQRLLRGVRGLGGARHPPGGRLPAVAGRRGAPGARSAANRPPRPRGRARWT